MSFNRSLLTQITKDLADKKKPAMPKAGAQQKIGESNPYYIDKSDIAGKGAFAKQFIPKGSPINMLHQINQPGMDYDFTQLGKSYNHSEDPNTINRLIGNKRFMVANQDIFPGQELTGDYRMQPDLEQPQEGWKMKNGGEMIKRADGSYSKRGLWDNIRANRGSGKKPTKQMLEQERRIKAKMQGGGEIDIDGQALQGLGKVFSTISDVMSIPARGVVKALTGKYQDPSQALGVTNPVAAWLTNSVLDPTNLVGAGVAAKVLGTAGKASKVAKVVKGVDKVAEGSRAVKIPAPRNISSLGVPHKEIVNALAERGMMLDQRGAFKKAVTPDDVEYFGTYGGRPVVGVNTPIGPEYFYKSTSWGGKKLIKPGDWQTFGQWIDVPNQVDNWFVKGDGYENLYGSQTFKNIAGQMDNVIMQKYGVPKQDLDKFLNFQNVQGNVDTFIPPRKEGGESDNVTKFMEVYQMKYGGGTPAFKQGGQTRDEREMVNGIADILSKVKDRGNRGEIAQEMIQDFEDEGVTYNVKKFMDLVNLKYGGTPYTHLQEGGSTDITSVIKNIPQEMVDESTSPYRVNILRNAVRNDIATNYGKPLADVDEAMVNEKTQELLADKKAQLLGTKLNLNTKLPGTEWASYNPNNQSISFTPDVNTMPVNQIKDIARHEYNHAFDDAGYYLTKYEKEAIKKSTKAAVDNSFFSPRSNEVQYLAQPTEVNARLRELRGALKDQGIYDGSKEDATLEHLNKGKKIRAYGDLLNVMPDKEIVNLLNTIASNNPKQGMPMAQEGGEMEEPYVEEAAPVEAPAQDTTEYTGSSIVDYLTTLGFESSKGFRKQLAKDMGIQGYNFSAAKNLELLNALKEAKGLPIGYEESFAPVSAKEMMALEQKRGAYVPMPGVRSNSQQAPVQQREGNAETQMNVPVPVPVRRSAPAPVIPQRSQPAPVPNVTAFNPAFGFYGPRNPTKFVPQPKAPARPVATTGSQGKLLMAQQPVTFPGMFNQVEALKKIKASKPNNTKPVKQAPVDMSTPMGRTAASALAGLLGAKQQAGKYIDSVSDQAAGLLEQASYAPEWALRQYEKYLMPESKAKSAAIGLPVSVVKKPNKPYSLTGDQVRIGSDTLDVGSLPRSSDHYFTNSAIVDLNKVNTGFRNRKDYTQIPNLEGNVLNPWMSPSEMSDNQMYLGIDKSGKMITGKKAEMKNAVTVSPVPYTQTSEIGSDYVSNQRYKFPSLRGADGSQQSFLNISLGNDGSPDANDRFGGGATIIETPDKKQRYLVRGSVNQVRKAFNDLKKNTGHKALNVYTLDNGSYNTGLKTADGISTPAELKAYERKNEAGSHGFYFKKNGGSSWLDKYN